MEARAIAKTLIVSPIKARLTIDMIRGKKAVDALDILNNTNTKPARLTLKVLNSAIANAEHNNNMDVNNLYVKTAYVNDGLRMKRMLPRAKGRGDVIIKRFSNITIIVAEKESK